MTNFEQKFIEDPQFLKWIFNTNPVIETYWERYLLNHPDEKDQILGLKQSLADLKFSEESLLNSEKVEMAKQILSRIDHDRIINKRSLVLTSLLKYAAVAIVFAVIGGVVVYLNMARKSVYQQFAEQTIQIPSAGQGPLLITSHGENVDLKKSNSSVDYSREGSIVLNNDSIIQAKDDAPNVMNQLVIPYGNQSRVVLSDNTVVWLNAGSRLVYPTLFKGKTREVLLFGEAFFEVSKNPERPFIVKTSDLQIKVLGTQFNVSAYAEDQVIQTVLKEGRVAIRRNNAAFYESDLVLKPNQLASFTKGSSDTKVYNVDVNYYTLWTKGLLSFNEADFNRVLKKVERFYNISIRFSDPTLGAIRISGKLDLKQQMSEVFEYLEKVSLTKIDKISDNQFVVRK